MNLLKKLREDVICYSLRFFELGEIFILMRLFSFIRQVFPGFQPSLERNEVILGKLLFIKAF